jgi:hypothetical protein
MFVPSESNVRTFVENDGPLIGISNPDMRMEVVKYLQICSSVASIASSLFKLYPRIPTDSKSFSALQVQLPDEVLARTVSSFQSGKGKQGERFVNVQGLMADSAVTTYDTRMRLHIHR